MENARRKIYAVLAGGVVLGVGAAVTLAVWNDSEFAGANFASGTFIFQGSTDGSVFEDHPDKSGAAALTFSTGFDALAPGSVVYAPFALRLDATSSVGATITETAPKVTGTLTKLTFEAKSPDVFGCSEGAFDTAVAVPATLEPGDVVNLCLKVTAGADVEQGASSTVAWQWDAVAN